MSDLQKYTFDRVFDAPPPVVPEPEPIAEDLPPPPPPPPTFSEEELEAARAVARSEGYDDGLAQGRADTQAQFDELAHRTTEKLSQQLAHLMTNEATRFYQQQAMTMEIALTIARKLLPEFTSRFGIAEIEAAVRGVMVQFAREPRLVVRVAESQLDTITQRLEAEAKAHGYEGKLIFMSEPNLQEGDCVVEWADGGFERNAQRLWQDIDRITAQVLAAGQGGAVSGGHHVPSPSAEDTPTTTTQLES
jgi:flagellar assembly protein FliH